MTKFSKIALATAVVAAGGAIHSVSYAEPVPENPSWYVMPSVGVSDPDDRFNGGSNAPNLGLRFGKQVSPSWDVQLGGTVARDRRDNGPRYHQGTLGVDGLYIFNRGSNIRPFGLIGAGAERDSVSGVHKTSPYVNIGAGVQVALSDQLSLIHI